VAYVENNEDGTVGGSHRCLASIVRHLDRARYEPAVVFYQNNRYVQLLRQDGIEIHVWEDRRRLEKRSEGRGRAAALTGALPAILHRTRFLRQAKIDLVHLNNSPAAGFADWLPAAKLSGVPCVAHARGGGGPGSGVGRWLVGHYDRVIAISDHVARVWSDLGIPRHRLLRLYDAIDVEGFRASVARSRESVRAELGWGEGLVIAAVVGHLRAWKGQDVVIAALGAMPPNLRTQLRVVFIGGTPSDDRGYAARLRALVASSGVADQVTFLGERTDVADLLNAADVFVHAATIPEPFGLVVLEAMALGKLVIASKHGGPGEVLGPGAGLTHDPASPSELAEVLSRVVAEPSVRKDLQVGAARRVASFGIREHVDAIQHLYDTLLRPPRTPAASL
jgi:glycosyltransferase involved in cell wall biosynthesis